MMQYEAFSGTSEIFKANWAGWYMHLSRWINSINQWSFRLA